jgi:beta-glucosidase
MRSKGLLFKLLLLLNMLLIVAVAPAQQLPNYKNVNKPIPERVNDLLQQLTLEEKISLLGYQSKAVPTGGTRLCTV